MSLYLQRVGLEVAKGSELGTSGWDGQFALNGFCNLPYRGFWSIGFWFPEEGFWYDI